MRHQLMLYITKQHNPKSESIEDIPHTPKLMHYELTDDCFFTKQHNPKSESIEDTPHTPKLMHYALTDDFFFTKQHNPKSRSIGVIIHMDLSSCTRHQQ